MSQYAWIKRILLLCIGICWGISGCTRTASLITQVNPLPDLEIVFQTMVKQEYETGYSLGFTDANGSTVVQLALPHLKYGPPGYPVWASNGDRVIFNALRSPYFLRAIMTDGRLLNYDHSEFFATYCRVAPIRDTHQVIFARHEAGGIPRNIPMSIRAVDLDTRQEITTYVHIDPVGGVAVDLETGTNPLYGQRLVFRRTVFYKQEMLVLDIETGQETILLSGAATEIMRAPAFSPDGASVAYVGKDGIYVITMAEIESPPQRIVELRDSEVSIMWPTAPSWSPDGQFLIYHRCLQHCGNKYGDIEDFNIFKVDVRTGKEVLLVEGGLNPYWRLAGD